jgi:isopentenyl-diphosphate delta-isomerase type 1
MELLDVLTERGDYTGETATRAKCHAEGLWHRAFSAFIIDAENRVLLQLRSKEKKTDPLKWDAPVAGHIDAGEWGREALIRESKEELGIDVADEEVKYYYGTTSERLMPGMVERHFNEYYVIAKDVDEKNLTLQTEEVAEAKYFSADEVLEMINTRSEKLSNKWNQWAFLKRLLESRQK